jgi:phytanoyl-CoA hydroxylase
VENGGLRMIPGTHRGPMYNHHREGLFIGVADLPPEVLERQVDLEVFPASAVVFHCRTVHSSPVNASSAGRRLLLFEYARADAWPLLGVKDWEAFAGSFVAGEPTVEPLVTDVPRRLPFPGLRGASQKH